MTDEAHPVTFRTLAEADGKRLLEPLPQDWPLEKWFAATVDVPLSQFSVEDLARACRQKMWTEHVVPHCLTALIQDPLAGEMYDGESLVSLRSVSFDHWRTHPNDACSLLEVLERAWDREDADDALRADILRFMARMVE